jgi:exopolyphosphatase/pppGpp-phosphohydrolase
MPAAARESLSLKNETLIRALYCAARSDVADGAPVTLLQIGAELTGIATGKNKEPAAVLILPIGARKTAADCFRHEPPTPRELEDAIAAIEDAIAPVRNMIAGDSALMTVDAAIREIALVAGLPGATVSNLSRDAVEQAFDRLTRVTLGRPAAREGIPAGSAFAATLLILREFMHHLQFTSITVKT